LGFLVTSNFVSGYEIETLGLVKGSFITTDSTLFYKIAVQFSNSNENQNVRSILGKLKK
jgi:hypothetical protein